nr:odorant binding protein [Semanotus bifasciatus]
MKCVFILYLFFVIHDVAYSAMTEKQLNATKKLVRNTCMNKAKPTSEQVDGLQKGQFIDDRNLQCYIYCILNTYKLIRKDNSFDWEGGIKALEANAPPNIAESGSKSIVNCKDAVKTTDDKCIAAYEITKCVYDDNPAGYFLP